MTARPIGSATVAFGLVSVPIKLYSAAEPKAKVSFNWLHRDCGSRLKQQYVCKKDGELVEKEDMVKGYEFAKEQYVLFTGDELKALEEKATESIEIAEFVPADQIERFYLSKIYYGRPCRRPASRRWHGTRHGASSTWCWCARWRTASSWSSCTTRTSCVRSPRCRSARAR
jgi:DNA end-binding protein Ku